jgi:hypothetical protein
MSGMTCTNCFRQTGMEPDFSGLNADAITDLCKNWRCVDCLDELDREAVERGEHPPTQPHAWDDLFAELASVRRA